MTVGFAERKQIGFPQELQTDINILIEARGNTPVNITHMQTQSGVKERQPISCHSKRFNDLIVNESESLNVLNADIVLFTSLSVFT